jgi:hypothetical protein
MTKIFFAVVIFVAVLAGGLVAARPDKAAHTELRASD